MKGGHWEGEGGVWGALVMCGYVRRMKESDEGMLVTGGGRKGVSSLVCINLLLKHQYMFPHSELSLSS